MVSPKPLDNLNVVAPEKQVCISLSETIKKLYYLPEFQSYLRVA